jgi:hypothetical protein
VRLHPGLPDADVAKLVYAADFNWSARQETAGAEPLKVGERRALRHVPIPSQAARTRKGLPEGVETGRAAPKEPLTSVI